MMIEHDKPARSIVLADIHSRLCKSSPRHYVEATDSADVLDAIAAGGCLDLPLAVCAGRHAMGGQGFIDGGIQIDLSRMDRVLDFDATHGLVRVEAGIQWPALMRFLDADERNRHAGWSIRQKQTGADRFSLGGSLAANIHGRGLRMKPFVEDIESFTLVDATGQVRRCNRSENAELLSLAIGGYGLFGVVLDVTLRLVRRCHVRREVEVAMIENVMERFAERIADGCLYGDFQFAIDPQSVDFLRRGVLSCYRRVGTDVPLTVDPVHLADREWKRLLHLAHTDKARAFDEFTAFYLRSHGQVYRSDEHQAGYYLDGYHDALDESLGHHGSEVISELYVPRDALVHFMRAAADRLRSLRADVIYGTVRLIERDDETFLCWAREAWACVIFNLHTGHDAASLAHLAACKRALIDLALDAGGSYYLTYHRCAERAQLDRAYPKFRAFLEAKRCHDPDGRFDSDWLRHYAPRLS